ncbi:chemotaxis protein CheD [Poseidonocella sedimentorum]|uniref:Probable chemoreceptor glutamine deamidase CheD n=1 Tax=Poseidonocella sedimentorum TaxID=871652 RepID=A0A1I6DDZ3_9RHOB|nr:hypothetical protein [Poseidonocella sedimentorum]SFR03685.1 chemotaxis protein CheD [Poseidonocella sedimentorum]
MTQVINPQSSRSIGSMTVYVGQGEQAVCDSPDTIITTTLGSCVSACLWDSARGAGGMNHIVLPATARLDGRSAAFGVNAMELLVNELLKLGARKSALRAKLFGGAQMLAHSSGIGARNAQFVQEFLQREGIPVMGGDTGGRMAREIRFWPSTGQARQRVSNAALKEDLSPVKVVPKQDDIEFF